MSDPFEAWLDDEVDRLGAHVVSLCRQVDDCAALPALRRRKAVLRKAIAEIEGKRLGLYAALCKYRELRK